MAFARCWALLISLLVSACASAPPEPVVPWPAAAASLPQVQGILNGERVLSGSVVLADDLLVPRGATLIIRPGTTVFVQVAQGTKIDPEYLSSATELLVRGSLQIQGTASQPVRFIPIGQAEQGGVAWAGIILDGAAASRIEGVELQGAETGVLCIKSSPLIRASLLRGCRYGVIAQEESSPQLEDNTIEKGEGGVFCWRQSHPRLAGNRIVDNDEEGVFIDRTSRPSLVGNRISGNSVGLAFYADDLGIDPGQVQDNGENLRRLQVSNEGRR